MALIVEPPLPMMCALTERGIETLTDCFVMLAKSPLRYLDEASDRMTYLFADLLDQVPQCLLGNVLRTRSLELQFATALRRHGDIGTRFPVQVLDNIWERTTELPPRKQITLIEQNRLDIATRN